MFSLILVASTSAAALLGAQARILAPGLCLITWNRGDCKNDDKLLSRNHPNAPKIHPKISDFTRGVASNQILVGPAG